ncbi:hypothetical protein [Brumimicrobium mesophilum]|uniref:hypothetical protein n=1 Tax=Brumimicrobium mesophilum TaxID=392717 RepID=UPI001F3E61AD|nr:hypothetical protein [Brumimicrobium mesophilum]
MILSLGCNHQAEIENDVNEVLMNIDSTQIEIEDLEPHISIDSLMKIEEELDAKLKDLEIKMDSSISM